PETSFLVVCGPAGEPISEAVYFHRRLVEAELPFGGVVVNRVHTEGRGEQPDREQIAAALRETVTDETLVERLLANLEDYQALATRDATNIAKLRRELRSSR